MEELKKRLMTFKSASLQVIDETVARVTWEHQFWLDMGGDLDQATPLLNSILALHNVLVN